MTADKIIFFTAGATPTPEEQTTIDNIAAAIAPSYTMVIRRADISNSYGAGIEDADYVAGTPPEAYAEFDEFDPDDEPITVADNDSVTVSNSAEDNTVTGTAVVDNAALTVLLEATDQIVSNSDTVVVKNSAGTVSKNGTATVSSGAISGVALASTEAIVSHAGAVVVKNSAGTKTAATTNATVSSGAVQSVNLAATDAIVSNSMALTGVTPSGSYIDTVTFTVASGVISAIVLS